MTTLTEHKKEHLSLAEAYFNYLDFGIEDERTRKEEERTLWLELLYASMTATEYKAIKNLPNITYFEHPELQYLENEHFLSLTGPGVVGEVAR